MEIGDLLNMIDVRKLTMKDEILINDIEKMLIDAFPEKTKGKWYKCIIESLMDDRISIIAVLDNQVVGFIGGIRKYNGFVYELHPLIVKKDFRKKGIGRLLIQALEEEVKNRGGLTVWLGTDDEDDATSLSQVDLYENTCDHIKNITNIKNHPYEFYQRLGYVIVGVLPDANGYRKPDIFMAKRVGK